METVMKILHLDSSITGKQSVSHTLSSEIVAALAARPIGAEVTYHDLANEPLLHLSPAHLSALSGSPCRKRRAGTRPRTGRTLSRRARRRGCPGDRCAHVQFRHSDAVESLDRPGDRRRQDLSLLRTRARRPSHGQEGFPRHIERWFLFGRQPCQLS